MDGYTVDDDVAYYGVRVPDELCSRWPLFVPSELEIYTEHPEGALSGTADAVRPVGTRDTFLKLVPRGDAYFAEAELRNYGKIDDARLEQELRISRLQGLVRGDGGLVLGLLLNYIDCGATTLACAAGPDVPSDANERTRSSLL